MRAEYSVPSYAVAFVGLRHDFIGDKFTSLALSKAFADGGFGLTVERKMRSVSAGHRKNDGGKGVLLVVRELPHLRNGLFKKLGHNWDFYHITLLQALPNSIGFMRN
jgi:hypothetical protein